MPKLSIVIAAISGFDGMETIKRACEEAGVELVPVRTLSTEPEMRLAGVRRATGEHIAVIGDRYDLNATWMRSALSAGDDVMCGCVAPSEGLSFSGWAVYLAEYSHIAPPMWGRWLEKGEQVLIAAGNVVYPRAVAARAMGARFHSQLLNSGVRVYFDPELEVSFARPPALTNYLAARYRDSRQWAAQQGQKRTRSESIFSACSRIALPALLLWRRARNVFSRRRYRLRFLAALPLLLLFCFVEAAGEATGFLSGDVQKP